MKVEHDTEHANAAGDSTPTVSITVTPRRIALFLAGIVVCVVVVGTVANIGIYHIASNPESNSAKVLRRFDLGHEPSIPNLYSSVALLCSAGLLALIGFLEHRQQRGGWAYWYALGIVFTGLGIDEAVQFHEMANSAISSRVETSGVLFLPWVIAGGIFAAGFAVLFIPFIARKSKRTLSIMMLGGGIFVFGAIGMEMVASLIFEQAGSEELGVQQISHTISQTIEEACEMLGVVMFIYALIDYLASTYTTVQLRFSRSDNAKDTA